MKKGIPKKILDELNINEVEEIKREKIVTAVVETHQVKFPVPGEIRKELDFKKGQKLKVRYDPKKNEIIYSL